MGNENERLFGRYRPPAFQTIWANTFEADILTMYTWPSFRIGSDCQRVGLTQEARIWYERALAINPNLPGARETLDCLPP